MKNILLVDDHKVVRDGLKFYLGGAGDYAIKDEAENGEEALELIHSNDYDLVITDLSMPKMDGILLLKEIRVEFPDLPVLALTMLAEGQHIRQMISHGVNGYVLKSASESEIKTAIDKILSGETYFSPQVTSTIINDMAGKKNKPKQRLTLETPLSNREKEVLKLVVDELSNPEIAEKLFISPRTVDAHKRNLLQKTGAKNIAGLVVYAIEHGITNYS